MLINKYIKTTTRSIKDVTASPYATENFVAIYPIAGPPIIYPKELICP
ncbi:hypothetical protein [Clostridium sp. Marseille-QA1073]